MLGERGMVRWKSEGFTLAFAESGGFARVRFWNLIVS